ncbi:Fanconi anemia core complex-associated protein 24 [Latimeria chalumnae]|uniref:FA core complex associated protein 24 n=1 Tax=Latimeria chalumnae TaxID=7897 RepID=H3ACK5_LATCH|nr:PREDICTED: G patch domain-containing protein 1 isoform X2 [Latimeria chalumnae]|eukprot:XP_006003680.1 PREDICTED: G patch domain-containing protein 1 isoform X2 [Latimeria chalumnae]
MEGKRVTSARAAAAVTVPCGRVLVSEKWSGSELAKGLRGKITPIFEAGLGDVDIHLSNTSCILYISQTDLVLGNDYKRKLVRFRNARKLHGIVVVEKTRISDQYFPAVQKFVVLELGMALVPVASQTEASQFIIQFVHEKTKEYDHNPFLHKSCTKHSESTLLSTVQQIPGVGKVKALTLLQHFPSIHHLCNATAEELEEVVGSAVAQQIQMFFHTS